jgi:4-amino-4-deoxy-L-arabinose transferase-like glycosyltransferase
MIVEGRRQRMPRVWLYVVVTFVIAWSCALPLFLWARERNLARALAIR